jgi:hypothetical protein
MVKEKSPKELGEIMAAQLDLITGGKATDETRRNFEAVANMIGKIIKMSATEIVYQQAKRKGQVGLIPSLDRSEK